MRVAQQAKREEEKANYAKQLEADRAQIIQHRIDDNLPAYSESELENAVIKRQQMSADAKLRGATVSV
jgi:hypothetical protein